ncbi:hypothetical protein ACJIZ3_009640 [Penstemon smallii]|uniref:Uncharacterized protein n=1 Tax=Penstemon smallii TaxID=265156 RepID=A0ABD3TD37_9LAMI
MKTTITTTSITPSSIPSPNPLKYSLERIHNHPSVVKFPKKASSIIVQCSKNGSPENGGSLKNILSGMVDERVEELLNKEENRDLLNGLEQASLRVEMAKRELAAIEKQEIEAKIMKNYVTQLESRASEIAECQKEITEARMMLEEAERSLTYQSSNTLPETKSEVLNKNEEKVESIKAALIAAVIGTLVELPISLTRATTNSQSLILPLAVTFISCALFGATFRYTIRKDLDNVHLKSGTSAAFGFCSDFSVCWSCFGFLC